MAIRTKVVVVVASMGEANRTTGAKASVVAVITTAAVVTVNPEVKEVAMEAETAWVEVTEVTSINLVALGTKDHVMILNRIICSRPG